MNKRQPLVLLLLGLGSAALVALVFHFASAGIEAERQRATERAWLDLLPHASYDNHPLAQPIPLAPGGLLRNPDRDAAYQASLQGQVSAILLPVTGHGYEGPIRLLVAISPTGQLLAAKVLQQRETPGLGDLILPQRSPWLRTFSGKSLADSDSSWTLQADGGPLDQLSGATLTSRAVKDALQRSLRFFDQRRAQLLAPVPGKQP
jgi:electron transport complex protein RnfG